MIKPIRKLFHELLVARAAPLLGSGNAPFEEYQAIATSLPEEFLQIEHAKARWKAEHAGARGLQVMCVRWSDPQLASERVCKDRASCLTIGPVACLEVH